MNIELLCRNALSILKSKFDLPKNGLIAGGAIANTIWEQVSGNKAVINDIDIFILDEIIKSDNSDEKPLFEFKENEMDFQETYYGLYMSYKVKDFYRITESKKDGINNIINYKSTTSDPYLIINSFDINCTKVAYSIEEDKFYWTEDFSDFLKTGELKISSLITPCHTAIRIAKKSKELNAKLNDFEFKLIQHSLVYPNLDALRYRFKERYFDLFIQYKKDLEKFFIIEEDKQVQSYIKNKYNDDSKIFTLKSKTSETDIKIDDIFHNTKIFDDNNLTQITRSDQLLFYMRKIYKTKYTKVWGKLSWFFKDIDYVDIDINNEDLNLLSKLCVYSTGAIKSLQGYKLSEQLKIIKKLFNIYKDDPVIAISILERTKINKNLSEIDLDLLEISARKLIQRNRNNKKVDKIFS